MSASSALLLPAIRCDANGAFSGESAAIEKALALGVGGFILFGGDQERVRALTKELRQKSRVPLLIAADLERGAGQQFSGATGLPPLAAIASLGDADAVRRAARLTAREARTLGLNWDLAPVCDLDLVPENPIVGTRSLGADSRKVAMLAQAWIQACQGEGVLACAKHFPGHGRTRTDSHAGMPVVDATRAELMEHDLAPFRAAIEVGVAGVMTAHVAYPALDASGAPATMSREMLQWLLRQQMRFDGLIVTDAMIMEGAIAEHGEEEAVVRALDAGCDLVLYPNDLEAVASAIDRAIATHRLDSGRIQTSLRRRLKWAQWSSPPNEYRRPSGTDVLWGAQLADRVIHVVHGAPPVMQAPLDVVIVDDDLGGPYAPPSREAFLDTLFDAGWKARRLDRFDPASTNDSVVALFGETRAWKQRVGYSEAALAAVREACDTRPNTTVFQFGHPRLAGELRFARGVVSAWGGEAAMQSAAARWIMRAR
ncbi:MAG: glycoside hydrolase family 3 N-terminal domain-containing protein [Gemmatimonadota bacterium]